MSNGKKNCMNLACNKMYRLSFGSDVPLQKNCDVIVMITLAIVRNQMASYMILQSGRFHDQICAKINQVWFEEINFSSPPGGAGETLQYLVWCNRANSGRLTTLDFPHWRHSCADSQNLVWPTKPQESWLASISPSPQKFKTLSWHPSIKNTKMKRPSFLLINIWPLIGMLSNVQGAMLMHF